MKLYSFLVSMTLLVSTNSYAEQTTSCPQIVDKTERLECFDAEFPKERKALPKPASTDTTSPAPEVSAQETITDVAITDQPVQNSKDPSSHGGLFDWKRQPEVETEIAAIRAGSKQRMVFRLANGQIWMQSTPRALPFKAGDKVTIKSGSVGGYIMRSASGTSCRVTLIEG